MEETNNKYSKLINYLIIIININMVCHLLSYPQNKKKIGRTSNTIPFFFGFSHDRIIVNNNSNNNNNNNNNTSNDIS